MLSRVCMAAMLAAVLAGPAAADPPSHAGPPDHVREGGPGRGGPPGQRRGNDRYERDDWDWDDDRAWDDRAWDDRDWDDRDWDDRDWDDRYGDRRRDDGGLSIEIDEDGVRIDIDRRGTYLTIGERNRARLRECWRRGQFGGLASLPPGIARQVARGRPLPPGIARQIGGGACRDLRPPEGFRFVLAGDDVLLIDISTRVIHDVLRLLAGE